MAVFNRVLVGHDGGERADDAFALARLVADRTGAELVLASVVPNPVRGAFAATVPVDGHAELVTKARSCLEEVAGESDVTIEVEQSSSPAHGLQSVAERVGADLVVLGSSSRAKPGHVRASRKARQLMSGGSSAVAVAPDGFRQRPELARIGVGVDGSRESQLASSIAIELAPDGAVLKLISVAAGYADEWGRWGVTYPLAEMAEATREAADKFLDEVEATIPERLGAERNLLEGTAPIRLAEASEQLDLLCLGSRGYGPVRRVLLGSVSTDVVNHAASAVLIVPRTDHDSS